MSLSEPVVFLVDDDRDIRSSLSRALTKRGFDVLAFASADDFLTAYNPDQAGCLILDYGMPGMNGLELQAHLAAQDCSIPIIFITGHGGISESVRAIKAGAVDFLEKPFRQDVLIERIHTAMEADQKTRLSNKFTRAARVRLEHLTSREREIARFMVANPSNASSKEIGRAFDISPRTADHHRARIFEKMVIGSVAELIDLSITAALFPQDPGTQDPGTQDPSTQDPGTQDPSTGDSVEKDT